MNALAVVAHHDDVVLWMGGTVQRLRSLGWNWHIVCFCTRNLPDRREYFLRLCEALGVKQTVFEFRDYQGEATFAYNDCEQMKAELLKAVPNEKFDWVFTHSRDKASEYGRHANHLEVAEVVTTLVESGRLVTDKSRLAHFCYAPIYGNLATVAKLDAARYLQLTYEELSFKCDWCKRVPDPGNLSGIGYPFPDPEAFRGVDLALPTPPFVGGR